MDSGFLTEKGRIESQAKEARKSVESQYGEAVSGVEVQAIEAREKIQQQAELDRTTIRQNIGQAEKVLQKSLQDARKAQAMARRRQAVGLGVTQVIQPDVSVITQSQQDLRKLRREVDTAEIASLTDIQKQVDKIMADLASQRKSALTDIAQQETAAISDLDRQYQEYIRQANQTKVVVVPPENSKKLSTGEYVDIKSFNNLEPYQQDLLNKYGVNKFNDIIGEYNQLVVSHSVSGGGGYWRDAQGNRLFMVYGTDPDTADFMPYDEWLKLPQNIKDYINNNGIDAYNKSLQKATDTTIQTKPDKVTWVEPEWTPVKILAAGVPVVVAEPTPVGEMIMGIAAIGALVYVGSKWVYDNKDTIWDALTDARGKAGDMAQAVMVTSQGEIKKFSESAQRQLEAIDYWQQKNIAPKIEALNEGVKLEQVIGNIEKVINTTPPPKLEGFELDLPDIKRIITGVPLEVKDKLSNIVEAVAEASRSIRTGITTVKTAQQTKEIPMTREQWNVIEEAMKALDKEKVDNAMGVLDKAMQRMNTIPSIARSLRQALEDLEVKRQILEAAKKAFVASLIPSPATGKALTPAEAASAAGLLISRATNTPTTTSIDTAISSAINKATLAKPIVSASQFTKQLTAQATSLASQTMTMTESQPQTLTQTQVEAIVRTVAQIVPQTLTQTQVETAIQTATQTLTRALTRTAVRTPALTRTLTRTAELTDTGTGIGIPPFVLNLPDGTSIQLTRQQWYGIVAWKQGIMYWLKYPNAKGEYPDKNTIHTREPIAGVEYAEGLGSVQKSIIAKGGKINKINFEMGFQDVRIIPTNRWNKPDIEFEYDPSNVRRKSKRHTKEKAPSIISIRR